VKKSPRKAATTKANAEDHKQLLAAIKHNPRKKY